jgi:hypothetical protein
VDKRLSHGLQFGANYTWSTNISDSEEVFSDSTPQTVASRRPVLRYPQNYLDRRCGKGAFGV